MFRFIILFVALVAGGGAAWIALAMRSESPAPLVVAAPAAATRDVLVAATDLARGQALSKGSVRWQAWPESAAQPTYISRSARPDAMDSLVGTMLRGSVIAGEPIREEKLGPVNSGLLSSMLPSGKRAVAVRITAENTAGGFILPNDRVDVVLTHELPTTGGAKQYQTLTILNDIRVLAVDQTSHQEKDKDSVVGKTATLVLTAGQAELLALAEQFGVL
jgi:pilus assembly protein CpaB